jgi:hypothetical protein
MTNASQKGCIAPRADRGGAAIIDAAHDPGSLARRDRNRTAMHVVDGDCRTSPEIRSVPAPYGGYLSFT